MLLAMGLIQTSVYFSLLLLSGLVSSSDTSRSFLRSILPAYAPRLVECPSESLTRKSVSPPDLELSWATSRKSQADVALADWLSRIDPSFGVPDTYPTLALSISGGGLRAFLTGAGIVKAFDDRDSIGSTSGLLQALSYVSGLSGGAWLLSSLASKDWLPVSNLQGPLWTPSLRSGIFRLTNAKMTRIANDVLAKQEAGFNVTLADPWARLISAKLIRGINGEDPILMSNIAKLPRFVNFSTPFPIIQALGFTLNSAVNYEFTPYEFGSWDVGVKSFMNITYLGSDLVNGTATSSNQCVKGYDDQGYITGTSSNLFNLPVTIFTKSALWTLLRLLTRSHPFRTPQDRYAAYPNPFKGQMDSTSAVSNMSSLYLVDGGEGGQWNPIWPFLHRDIDVAIVNDNSDSGNNGQNFPTGQQLRATYLQAAVAGLTRMPFIPDADTFTSQGLNKRATFFGCKNTSVMTLIYLPNQAYSFPSNQSLSRFQYNPTSTASMIDNGIAIANLNGSSTWPTCLGCGIMIKSNTALPDACTACLEKYCYN